MSETKNRKKTQAGFTLIELLIVMIILAGLAALVAPKLFGKADSSRQKAAAIQISLLGTALDAYRLDMGRYPETDVGLEALRTTPDDSDQWDGPYLPKAVPPDPWGEPYHYKSPSEHGDYEIISYGSDKQPGGEKSAKDIVSW